MTPRHWRWIAIAVGALAVYGCSSAPHAPMATAGHVDLDRYMGDWYVIANIPPWIEKGAHNSIETYRLDVDGTIATTFSYRAGAFDGESRTLKSRGYVLDRQSNAVWGVQFVWPIKADYRIVHVSPDYRFVVVGRVKRDYLWIMARTPEIPAAVYDDLVARSIAQGYDASLIRKVPQKWN